MEAFKEISDESKCPCGSKKQYKNCCKKKYIIYGYQNNKLVKKVPIHKDLIPILKDQERQFEEYYGRLPGDKDFLSAFAPIYNDEVLLKAVYTFRKLGFPENKIYAFYKSDGLFPCDLNIELLSDTEIKEFEDLCEEYDKMINSPIAESANAVQFISFANEHISEQIRYIIDAIINSFNDLIHRHSKTNTIYDYQMTEEIDYCIFSALKTIKTLHSIRKLIEEHLPECIYALGRSIFENYMYISNINQDPLLFSGKLLPLVDNVNYSFAKTPDGRINYKKVIHSTSGEKRNIHITINSLCKNLPYSDDEDIYDLFYKTACKFVHVDVMSAQNYFSVTNPYDEIDPSIIAGLIISALALLLLSQISQNRFIIEQYRSDVSFLCRNNIYKKLITCIEIVGSDPEHQNTICDLLLSRLNKEFSSH